MHLAKPMRITPIMYSGLSFKNNNAKKISMTDGDDNFYSFDELGKNSMMSDSQIISQFNMDLKIIFSNEIFEEVLLDFVHLFLHFDYFALLFVV